MSDTWIETMACCREAVQSGNHTLAMLHAREAQAIARQDRRLDRAIEAMMEHARILADLDQNQEAVDTLHEAILLGLHAETADTDVGVLYLLAGRYLARLGRIPDAIDHLEHAVERLDDQELRLEAFTRLAIAAERMGWYHITLPAQQERVSLSLSLYELDDPRTLNAIVGLGEAYRIQGLLDDARAILEIAISAVDELESRTDAQTAALASALHNLGLTMAGSNPSNARTVLNQALQHLQRVVGPNHPAVSRTHMAIGLLDRDQGRDEAARQHWQTALKPLNDDDPLHGRLEALLGG